MWLDVIHDSVLLSEHCSTASLPIVCRPHVASMLLSRNFLAASVPSASLHFPCLSLPPCCLAGCLSRPYCFTCRALGVPLLCPCCTDRATFHGCKPLQVRALFVATAIPIPTAVPAPLSPGITLDISARMHSEPCTPVSPTRWGWVCLLVIRLQPAYSHPYRHSRLHPHLAQMRGLGIG